MPKEISRDPVLAIQLPEELMYAVDSWATDHGMSRSEAITDLLGRRSHSLGRLQMTVERRQPN